MISQGFFYVHPAWGELGSESPLTYSADRLIGFITE